VSDEAQVLPEEASANDLVEMDDAAFSKQLGLDKLLGEGEPVSPADADSTGEEVAEEVVVEEEVAEGEEVEEEVVEEVEETPKPKKPPLTRFAVFEGEEEVELPADLEITYEANGKPRKVAFDKLVAMAQMGHYNHEKQQEMREQAAQAQSAIQERNELAEAVTQYQQYYDKVFTDLEFFDTAREAYLKEQSPERRVQREHQSLKEQKEQLQSEREAMQVAHVVSTDLTPALVQMVESNPLVSQNEVIGLYTQLTAPLLVRGRLPVERLAEVQTLVKRDLAYQVQGLQDERADAEARKNKALQVEKGKTVKAKRQIARTVAPKGASVPDTKKPKVYESAQDWLDNDPLLTAQE